MSRDGSETNGTIKPPHWLSCELTYDCPLQCPYCYNPIDFALHGGKLSVEEWMRVLNEARALGVVQVGFTGGEPLLFAGLETLVAEARRLGCYTNLITSGIGLDEARARALKEAGLDKIQVAFQAATPERCNYLAGRSVFEEKLEAARLVKRYGFPMTINFVVNRHNIGETAAMLDLAVELKADYVEFANLLPYSWAWVNVSQLMPTLAQLRRSEAVVDRYKARYHGVMKIFYVVPDYFEGRPKACLKGWGEIFMNIAPDGTAEPCQLARQLPGITFPNVRDQSLEQVWRESDGFNRFRGFAWMKEPCRSCPDRFRDYGGCRCQAYMMTGDPSNPDPACHFAPDHHKVVELSLPLISGRVQEKPLVFRNPRNSRLLANG